MPHPAASSERVLVCGLGHVGYRVARLLCKLGVGVVVVGQKMRGEWTRALIEQGASVVDGDPSDEASLAQANVAEATAVIGAADADLENLEVALDARRLRADLRLVLRVFDRDLARSLEQSFGNARALGASALAAPVMAFSALGQPVRAAFDLGDHAVFVGTIEVDEASPLVGLSAREVREQWGVALIGATDSKIEAGASVTLVGERASYLALGLGAGMPPPRKEPEKLVRSTFRTIWNNSPRQLRTVFLVLIGLILVSIAVFRFGFDPPIGLVEAIYYTVTTVTTVGYGDITPRTSGAWQMLYATLVMVLGSVTMAVLYSFATSYVVSEQLRAELGRPPMPREGHVIVVGLGNVGYRTWDELVRAGYPVVAIDANPEREFVNAIRSRCPVIFGDARLTTTLTAAGLERAVAVVAATGDDAVNLAVALTAHRLAPNVRTVVRVFDADFAHKLEHGGLVQNAISTSRVAAPAFAASALFSNVVGAFSDDDGLLALRFHPTPSEWSGRSPTELGADVLLVEREGRLSAWDPDEPLPEGAGILIADRRRFA